MIGIDIGNRFIKLVALRGHRGRWRLLACLAQETGSNPVLALRTTLQTLPLSLRRKLPHVAIALPTAELSVKSIQLPSGLSHEQLDMALGIEFEQSLQTGADKICLDYRIPYKSRRQVSADQPVLAVACRQSFMDAALATLSAVGIAPTLVCADIMLIAEHLASVSYDSELHLFIDAGATGVRLHSIRAGVPLYSRAHGMVGESCSADNLIAYTRLLRRALQQYLMFDMLSKPARVYLYGGAAVLPGVHQLLEQSFALPVHRLDAFSAWKICAADQVVAHTNLHACAFTLACVLAGQETSCV